MPASPIRYLSVFYVIDLGSGTLRRLTWDDGGEMLDGWSADGRWVYFSSTSLDIAGMNDLFHVRVDGGTPTRVSHDRYVNEFFAAPSPDGDAVAFSARGVASGQWWRNGHSHLDESEIWLLGPGPEPRYTRLTSRGARHLWPMWSADGATLYFMSDRSGCEHLSLTSGLSDLALSPDGKKVAFVVRGEVFAASAKDGGDAARVTRTVEAESQPTWAPDSRRLAYVFDRAGTPHLHVYDFGSSAETALTTGTGRDETPRFSPDGKTLAFVRDQRALLAIDLVSRQEQRLAEGRFGDALGAERPVWSPDGRWLAILAIGEKASPTRTSWPPPGARPVRSHSRPTCSPTA